MTVATPPTALEAAFQRVDQIADRAFAGWTVPGLVYGVVADGRLVHSRGLGTIRLGEQATPDGRSVFRIASMTKSFTAATVLSLRDEGRLALDDPIERYVPEVANLRYPTADSPRITIRHLLTMTAGFPTDDPWGDRQQSLDVDEFRRLLAGGLSFAWSPGTRFEYSNTGYGILGRLITNVGGREYRDVVRERLLLPLELGATVFAAEDAAPERLAKGYVWRDGRFLEEPTDGYGALAAMGGLFSTVEDVAKWIAFLQDAWPPRDDPDDGPALPRASRREMQTPMADVGIIGLDHGLLISQPTTDAAPQLVRRMYGLGLEVVHDIRFGRIVGHSGGYPGFGSHMRWHLAAGLGVVVLTNHRYGLARVLAKEVLEALLESEVVPSRRTVPNAATARARERIDQLIERWDDRLAADVFAMNVDLDQPLAARRAFVERLRKRHGELTPDPDEPIDSLTPFHAVWWLRGARGGRVKAEILLSPQVPPMVQTLNLTSVPEPTPLLRSTAERIVDAINGTNGSGEADRAGPVVVDWPASVAVSEGFDLAPVVRSMRATEARFAPVGIGGVLEGDGASTATLRLVGPRGQVDLFLTLDPERECVVEVALVPVRLVGPVVD